MRVSRKYRMMLRQQCEQLIDAGINCFPKWLRGQAPAFRRGERYAKYLVTPIREDDEFKKLVLSRFDDPRVGGIVVVGRVGGLLPVDYDVPKAARVEDRIQRLVKELGHMVYIDRRIAYDGSRVLKKGLHAILYVDKNLMNTHEFIIRHQYSAEFTVKTSTPVTVSPSLRLEKTGKTAEFSVYLQLSSTGLLESVYDERLEVLPRLVEILGGKLQVARIDASTAETREYTGEPGKPYHGLELNISADHVFMFLRNYARIIGCDGLEAVIDTLEAGEPLPVHYFIYKDYVPDTGHPRSSWTLIENIIGRILGEAGAADEAVDKIVEAFQRSEDLYMKYMGQVDHRTLRRNISAARRFKEFGHDKAGACVFKLAGLCHKQCHLTVWAKLQTSASREALERAYVLAKAGKTVEV